MLEAKPEHGLSRFGAEVARVRNDLGEGMKTSDSITLIGHGVRNALVAAYHGVQSIIPIAANSFSDQKFDVVEREGALHGTRNSVNKVIETKGIIGKASAIFAEATDGPVDDGLHVIGGAEWIIEPSNNYSQAA